MSIKNPTVPGCPAPRSGHGAASVIPHLEEDNARERPSGFDEQHAQDAPLEPAEPAGSDASEQA